MEIFASACKFFPCPRKFFSERSHWQTMLLFLYLLFAKYMQTMMLLRKKPSINFGYALVFECNQSCFNTKRGHAPNEHAPFDIRETNSAMKHHYMMLICLEVFGSSFMTILGRSIVRTPFSTFALIISLSTSSGKISVCWNFV